MRLDHVQLAAPPGCEDAARAFFVGLLGLEEIPKQGATARTGGVWLRLGNSELHVGVSDDFVPAKKAHVALQAEDVAELEAIAKALEGAGHPIRWNDGIPGVRRLFTEDPWGNRIELMAR